MFRKSSILFIPCFLSHFACDPEHAPAISQERTATLLEEFPIEELTMKMNDHKPLFVAMSEESMTKELIDSCNEAETDLIGIPTPAATAGGHCYVWGCNYVGMGICCFDNPRDCCKIGSYHF